MKALAIAALCMMAPTLAKAQAFEVSCVDWRYVNDFTVQVRSLSERESGHLGADFGFKVVTRSPQDRSQAEFVGLAVEARSADPNAQIFYLFKGAPYVKDPARADGKVVVVLDQTQTTMEPTLTWEGQTISLRQCAMSTAE